MSIRSFITLGLLATPAVLAAPNQQKEKTVTITETKEIIKYKTKTDTTTKTKTTTATVTGSCTAPTVYSSSSTSASSTSATSASSATSATSTITSSSSVASSSSSVTNTNPTTTLTATATGTYGLNDAAKATGKLWFGTAADIPGTGELQDVYYMTEYNNTNDFGGTTPANIMKFEFTEPEENVYNFTGGDEFIAIAHATDKLVRCHNLIWYNQIPDWVTEGNWTNGTNGTLAQVLVNHITNLIEHFGDECYSWDVVNEALSDDPAGAFQSNIWSDTIGAPDYFYLAYETAYNVRAANNLSVKLYYNDYNIESAGNKSSAAQQLVKDLQARGTPLDGVGLESHFIVGETPSQSAQASNMAAFTSLGIDVAVTELDVRLTLPATDATETQQVADYYSTVAACVETENCIGITVWDFDDTYSWIPSSFAGQGYGDLFLQPGGADTPLVRKAAYDGCLEALEGKPESSP